ncbi:MAG: Asp-tRNA(Asn)/Glu-tRNA(Gln) amidotransferase subunit GatC [Oscillospiraceae bacterium]|nr:Asp-tRNA(Asn)/Glu-tRNA(Gln) amidotransferase subunit GatC [Oscillospiraceae bacterium]
MVDMKHYEHMVMLELSDDERMQLSKRLDTLIESFSALEQIDTDGVLPLVSVVDGQSILREDVAVKMISRDALLSNAPEQYDGYFQVPGAIE